MSNTSTAKRSREVSPSAPPVFRFDKNKPKKPRHEYGEKIEMAQTCSANITFVGPTADNLRKFHGEKVSIAPTAAILRKFSHTSKTKTKDVVVIEEGDKDKDKDKAKARYCHGEKDVIVIVGDREFHESSHMLCYWSKFFHDAFQVGTKEAKARRFECPDQDPTEWELLMKLLDPFDNSAKLSSDNIHKLLPWFEKLEISKGLATFDELVLSTPDYDFTSDIPGCPIHPSELEFKRAKRWLPVCVQYNLVHSKAHFLGNMKRLRQEGYFCYGIKDEDFDLLVPLISDCEDCRRTLWEIVASHLVPHPVTDRQTQDALISSGALRSMQVADIKLKRIIHTINKAPADRPVNQVREELWEEGHDEFVVTPPADVTPSAANQK